MTNYKGNVQRRIFAITKDSDYLQNPDKQAEVHDLKNTLPEEIVIVEGRSNNGNKTRQAADKQLKDIKALPGAILREVFDFEEDREG